MDEQEYKATYNRINPLKCVFEKAMCSLKCNCSQGSMFRLADRHGFSCHSPVHQKNCADLLNHLRARTRFVFKLTDIDGPLPHNKEIRVQNGGLLGLQKLLYGESPDAINENRANDGRVNDVSGLVDELLKNYGSIERLPYDRVMPMVMAYEARPRRRSRSRPTNPDP